MTKSETSENFKTLERLTGIRVYTFNSNRRMPPGSIGWMDRVIITRSHIICIEDKIGRDVLSDKQKEVGKSLKALSRFPGSRVVYYLNYRVDAVLCS